jgi:hypothetical protein
MKHLLTSVTVATLVLVSSVASANSVAGTAVTVQPALSAKDVERDGFTTWGAWGSDRAAHTSASSSPLATRMSPMISASRFMCPVAFKSRLSDHVIVLADAGAGVTQQTSFELQLFESEDDGGFKSVQVLPSAVTRVQLVPELGTVGETTLGLALASEARV